MDPLGDNERSQHHAQRETELLRLPANQALTPKCFNLGRPPEHQDGIGATEGE